MEQRVSYNCVNYDDGRDTRYVSRTAIGTAGVISGIAVPFNTPTEVGGIKETVRHGAFSRIIGAIRNGYRKVLALINHNPQKQIGEVNLSETEEGLRYEISLPLTDEGKAIAELARNGELSGVSIGFNLESSNKSVYDNTRVLTDVDLREISILTKATQPAYSNTSVSTRNKQNKLKQWLKINRCLNS